MSCRYVALVLYLSEWLDFQRLFPEAAKYLRMKIAPGATDVDNLVKELAARPAENTKSRFFGDKQRGQVAVLAALLIMLFVLLAAGLVDGYLLLEARNWGYQAAQQAALAGVSQGRDWGSLASPPCAGGPAPIRLDASAAQKAATSLLQQEMSMRGIVDFTSDVRVLPDYEGGSISGYPPAAVRLGAGRGNWSSNEPSMGVYFSFPVSTFLLSFVGRPTVQVSVFASAGVHQPDGACKP